jgi:hypothetical protein
MQNTNVTGSPFSPRVPLWILVLPFIDNSFWLSELWVTFGPASSTFYIKWARWCKFTASIVCLKSLNCVEFLCQISPVGHSWDSLLSSESHHYVFPWILHDVFLAYSNSKTVVVIQKQLFVTGRFFGGVVFQQLQARLHFIQACLEQTPKTNPVTNCPARNTPYILDAATRGS